MFSGSRGARKEEPSLSGDHAYEALLLLDALALYQAGEPERGARCLLRLQEGGNLASLINRLCPEFSLQRDRRSERIRRTVLNPINRQVAPLPRVPEAVEPRAASVNRKWRELTTKQRVVLGLLRDGQSNQQIAKRMCVSLNTVKWHLKNLSRILGAKSRYQVLKAAEREGLI